MKRLLDALDILTDFYESPSQGAREILERAPVGLGVACFLLSGATLTVAHALKGGGALWMFKLLPWAAVLVASGLAPLAGGFLMAGVLHLTAELLGARQGSAVGMFILLGLCQLLYILYLPVVLTTEIFSASPGAWRGLALFALGLVSLGLKVASIRSNYGFSTGRAGAVLVLPYVAALFLGLGALAAALGGVLSLGRLFE